MTGAADGYCAHCHGPRRIRRESRDVSVPNRVGFAEYCMDCGGLVGTRSHTKC